MNPKHRHWLAFVLGAIVAFAGAHAQTATNAPPDDQNLIAQSPAAAPAPAAQAPSSDRLSPSDLEELLGPIALYPDPLLANVLAASVYPDEVAAAAKFVGSGGKADQIASQPWEAPVKAVAEVPAAIQMLGQYPEWTVALGQAYLVQAQDVMAAIQSLRQKAQENGALQTTPQQTVAVEQGAIAIQPADPEIIYVPTYSPEVVYAAPYYGGVVSNAISFGLGVAASAIWSNNLRCDWHGGCVGWGWHGGDVNFNRNVNVGNINRGNVNIGNRVGNEGNAWAPDRSKNLATAKPSQLPAFRGGQAGANRPGIPGGRAGAGNLPAARPGAGNLPSARPGAGNLPSARPGAGNLPSARPGAGNLPSARPGAGNLPSARPGAGNLPSARPGAGNLPSARPGASNLPSARPGAGNLPSARPPATAARPQMPPRQPSASAFSGGASTRAVSQRGASSRSQSFSRSGGGGGRSAARGGGGGRSSARGGGGGGRSRGGGGRR